jgi:Zn finger protein HypA/HybF involved in hydrogenase expression
MTNGTEKIPTPPSDYVPALCRCWTCRGSRKVPERGRWVACPACDGSGYTAGRQVRVAVDEARP